MNHDLSHSEAQFYNSRIYFISYDETHFIFGFTKNPISNGVYGDISDYKIIKNTEIPFDFEDDIKIKNIKFIRNTKYVYIILSLHQVKIIILE